jgi:hypothetical protein
MMGKKLKLLLFSMLFAAALPAVASTIVPVDLAAMVDRADLIFVGTVIGSESVPTADGNYAFTYVTFDVDQSLKGISRSGKTITLRFAGGQSGESFYEVEGAPTFTVGGRHLLFVQGNDQALVPLVGWSQGKLDIVANPITQEPTLVDHAGLAIDGVSGKGWRRAGAALQKETLQGPRSTGVTVLSEEGMRVELEAPPRIVDHAAPIEQFLGQLRAFINTRKASSPAFRDTQFVDSASKAGVPATFRLTAGRAPVENDRKN